MKSEPPARRLSPDRPFGPRILPLLLTAFFAGAFFPALSSGASPEIEVRLPAPGTPPGQLELRPYEFIPEDGEPVAGAELGTLTVAESRGAEGSRVLRLAFVRLPATAGRPGPPIVYLAGGPGSSGIESARGDRWPLFDALRAAGDVILLDQRGTGASRPNLLCGNSWSFPPDEPLEVEPMLAAIREHSRKCAERLRSKGADLSAYDARAIADDVDELRRALKLPKIHLLGTSYGTHIALELLARHGEGVERAVLAGVTEPGRRGRDPGLFERRLPEIERTVAARRLLPPPPVTPEGVEEGAEPEEATLAERIARVLGKLESSPRVLIHRDLIGRREVELAVGKLDVQLATVRRLGSLEDLESLDRLYRDLDAGNFGGLASEVLRYKRGWLGRVLPYTAQCAEASDAPPSETPTAAAVPQADAEAAATGALLGDLLDFPFPEVCPAWGLEPRGETRREPVSSNVPTLLISGTLDVRTPLENAEEAARHLSAGRHLVLEGAGHGDDLLISSPRLPELIADFLLGRGAPPERLTVYGAPTASPAPEPNP